MTDYTPNPDLDLVLERTVPVAPDRVWAAWTEPGAAGAVVHPGAVEDGACDLDVRPGGRCITTMESPEGEQFPNAGCYLQVEPERLLVFTSAMTEGFRPVSPANGDRRRPPLHGPHRDHAGRRRRHPLPGGRHARRPATAAERHGEMGFHEGWGAALDQLVALMG